MFIHIAVKEQIGKEQTVALRLGKVCRRPDAAARREIGRQAIAGDQYFCAGSVGSEEGAAFRQPRLG